MTPNLDYTIRTMTRQEVDIAIAWAANEGWNPGLEDAECFYRADPEGFLIALLDNKPVAAISAVKYGSSYGFIGLYIVLPEYRTRGAGFLIGRAALKRLEGRTIGLDGVLERQENYRRLGFSFAYSNIRYEGFGRDLKPLHQGIKPLSGLPFETVLAYDKPFFPDDRSGFLKCWTSRESTTALGIMDDGRLAGYGVIRPCRAGFKIGPLFADRPEFAEELFCALTASVPEGVPVYLDIPEPNSAATELVQRHGMNVVFKTARMYMGQHPQLPIEKVFGITTFELG
ncbi:MAG: GNAT family N-acetyltransferase [Chlorobiaceae bacterium]|nr:GNAT family N-acetyltransferase [Chlorobiaceae bacterium]